MKYTDNEIVKALEWLDNTKGVCSSDDDYVYGQIIQDLIKRQQAEIERLQSEKDSRIVMCLASDIDKAKSEAIKEFAERLKDVFVTIDGTFECWEVEEHIDDLAKEMTGDGDES